MTSGISSVAETAGNDAAVLRRFLAGELSPAEVQQLEERLDREPELLSRLGAMARADGEALAGPVISDETERITTECGVASAAEALGLRGLTVGPRIGRGGMAHVHLGRQHSVDRTVAIKTVRLSDGAKRALLEEAYVTGPARAPQHRSDS